MSERVVLKLAANDIFIVRMSVETFIAKKVYGYIYATRTGNSSTVLSLVNVVDHIQLNYADVCKIHRCIIDRVCPISTMATEDLIISFYYKCLESMKWRERCDTVEQARSLSLSQRTEVPF